MLSDVPYSDQLAACSRCALCLPACPTFKASGHESDSPRGRVQLMLLEATGGIERDAVTPFLESCIQCRQCEPVCPTGVRVTESINEHLGSERHHAKLKLWRARAKLISRQLGI